MKKLPNCSRKPPPPPPKENTNSTRPRTIATAHFSTRSGWDDGRSQVTVGAHPIRVVRERVGAPRSSKPGCRLRYNLNSSGARLDAVNGAAARVAAQQPPGFLVLAVLRIPQLGTKEKAFLASNLRGRNDVPLVQGDQIHREEIKRIIGVRPLAAATHGAMVAMVALMHDRFDLHSYALRTMLHHKVITGRLSPRFAYLQSVLCGARHEAHLRPLSPLLRVLDVVSLVFH